MAQLTQEQSQYIIAEVKAAARQVMIGRRLIPTPPPVGFGAEVIGFDKLTEMAAGRIDLEWGAGFSEDTIGLTRNQKPIPVLSKTFELNRRQVEASQRTGTPLPTTAINAATYAVCRKEDDLILMGYSADGTIYDIPGLWTGYGHTTAGADFGTTPATNIPASMDTLIGLLAGTNIPGPYTMVLNAEQYNQLFTLLGTASTDMLYDYAVKRMAAVDANGVNAQGRVFQTPALAAATGLILGPPSLKYAEYQLGADITAETKELEKGGNTWGVVYVTGTVLIYDAYGIGRFTAI
jgi:uncharacterized linocin/CFP29 family protein